MKEKRLFVILLIMICLILGTLKACGQSFYANRYEKGRTTQLNGKTVMQKKQVNAYQQHSLLYKMRREASYKKKRKNFAKSKTR